MGLTQEIADFVANTRFHAKATPKPSSNGEELLLAYTLGVEVECRIADAINPRHYQVGFHSTATMGGLGAAVAVAKILKLKRRALAARAGHTQNQGAKSGALFESDSEISRRA